MNACLKELWESLGRVGKEHVGIILIRQRTKIAFLEEQNAKYREALEAIVKHELTIGGSMSACSSTYLIAKRALTIGEEGI